MPIDYIIHCHCGNEVDDINRYGKHSKINSDQLNFESLGYHNTDLTRLKIKDSYYNSHVRHNDDDDVDDNEATLQRTPPSKRFWSINVGSGS